VPVIEVFAPFTTPTIEAFLVVLPLNTLIFVGVLKLAPVVDSVNVQDVVHGKASVLFTLLITGVGVGLGVGVIVGVGVSVEPGKGVTVGVGVFDGVGVAVGAGSTVTVIILLDCNSESSASIFI
jgi:hypothetical protein